MELWSLDRSEQCQSLTCCFTSDTRTWGKRWGPWKAVTLLTQFPLFSPSVFLVVQHGLKLLPSPPSSVYSKEETHGWFWTILSYLLGRARNSTPMSSSEIRPHQVESWFHESKICAVHFLVLTLTAASLCSLDTSWEGPICIFIILTRDVIFLS